MKRFLLPAAALMLAMLACVMPGSVSQEDYNAAVLERDALQTQAAEMQVQLDQQAADLAGKAETQQALASAREELETARAELTQLYQAQQDLEAELATAAEEKDAMAYEMNALYDQYSRVLCEDDVPGLDFDQPSLVQQRLTDWIMGWESKERRLLDAETETIWDDAEIQRTVIRYEIPSEARTVKQIFVIYFDDGDYSDAVYWTNQACWIYPP